MENEEKRKVKRRIIFFVILAFVVGFAIGFGVWWQLSKLTREILAGGVANPPGFPG